MSWEDAWREGRTGWDAGGSPPALIELVEAGRLPTGRVLVPGCGAGYDVLTLAAHPERRVLGLEVAPTARQRFEALRSERAVPAERAQVDVGDFFALTADSPFDLVWDYTFLCAIDLAQRGAWVDVIDRVLAPDGELVTLLFPATEKPPFGEGPPHPIPPDTVRALLEPRFVLTELERVEASHPGREGMEWLARWRRSAP